MTENRSPEPFDEPPTRLLTVVAVVTLAFVALLGWCSSLQAQTPPDPLTEGSLTGGYVCTGEDGDGKAYTIALDVRAFRDGYLLQWSSRSGKVQSQGARAAAWRCAERVETKAAE